jgi:hypothetical protein
MRRPQCRPTTRTRTRTHDRPPAWPPVVPVPDGGGSRRPPWRGRVMTWLAARSVFRMRLRFSPAGAVTLSVATATLLLVSATGGFALSRQGAYLRCKQEHLSVRGAAGGSLTITNLRVIRISCSRAAAAVRASRYEATPGGPLFTSPGFSCGGPVGLPPPRAKPRYYYCDHRRQRFEFLVPGFS